VRENRSASNSAWNAFSIDGNFFTQSFFENGPLRRYGRSSTEFEVFSGQFQYKHRLIWRETINRQSVAIS
jgi:hypothetical protein